MLTPVLRNICAITRVVLKPSFKFRRILFVFKKIPDQKQVNIIFSLYFKRIQNLLVSYCTKCYDYQKFKHLHDGSKNYIQFIEMKRKVL